MLSNKILAIEKGHVRFAPPAPSYSLKFYFLYDLIITSPLYAINQLGNIKEKTPHQ